MARFASKAPASESRPSLTPMIDVVFLLLVFFILSAKFISLEQQLDTALPRHGDGPPLPRAGTEVIIDIRGHQERAVATGLVTGFGAPGAVRARELPSRPDPRVGGVGPDRTAIEGYLAQAASRFGHDVPVTVRFDDRIPLQWIVDVIDAGQRLELTNLGIGAPEME